MPAATRRTPTPTPPPSRRRRAVGLIIGAIAVVVTVIAVWWQTSTPRRTGPGDAEATRTGDGGETRKLGVMRLIDGKWQRVDPRDPRIAGAFAPTAAGMVRVEGTVYEGDRTRPVGGVEVVFAGSAGEATTTADGGGKYQIDVAPGAYRAFVRGDGVLSVGPRIDDRLPSPPQPGVAGVPDDDVAPMLMLAEDEHGIDLAVVRGGAIVGVVTDPSGKPIAGAVVRAFGGEGVRPVLGSDFAETDAGGNFRLEVPAGGYALQATHDRWAGIDRDGDRPVVAVEVGADVRQDLTLVAGCVIEGKVVLASGAASGDGAIERQWGGTDQDYGPAGKIDSDGGFRWTTTAEDSVVLRAWPWKSPPTNSRRFECRDGARFRGVVFTVPAEDPSMSGVVVSADGEPARYAFLDITALSPGGINQQERADGNGEWGVFAMPPGDYRFQVYDPDGGIVTQLVTSPSHDVRLVLGGTGSLAGKANGLDAGSFTLELSGCDDAVRTDRAHRIVVVPVRNGTYRVDGLPACGQMVTARAPDHQQVESVTITAGGVASVDFNLAPRKKKHVTGVVRDASGAPVAGAYVSATYSEGGDMTTGADGEYAVDTYGGEGIYARKDEQGGFVQVGDADVPAERLDIQLAQPSVDDQLLEDD